MKSVKKISIAVILTTGLIGLTACGKKSATKSTPSADTTQVSTSSNPAEAAKEWKENQKQQQNLAVDADKESTPAASSEKIVLLNDSELVDFTEEVLPEVKVSLTQAPSPTKEIAKNNDVNNDLSSDFCSSKNTATSSSKKAFVCSVLPSAIRMNKQIYKQRLLVIALEKKSEKEGLSDKEEAWIAKLKTQYGLPMTASYSDLLSRVDVVPIALLITQASMESGWGTSRASKEAKNLFGVHGVHGKDNCIAALQNPNVCIKKYASFDQSIGDYMQFLNTKKSTQNFRNKRKQLRDRNQSLDAVVLASTLTSYSELGVRYTEMIVSMMKKQNFVSLIFNEDDVEAETV